MNGKEGRKRSGMVRVESKKGAGGRRQLPFQVVNPTAS